MNEKKKYHLPLEYRIGMISAFSLMLLSVILPLFSVKAAKQSMSVSLLSFFSKSKLEQLDLLSLDQATAVILNTIRCFIIIFALLAILGIVCYTLEFTTRWKEGIIITLILTPWSIFSGIGITVLMARIATSATPGGTISLGVGTIFGWLACGYAFFRPLVYLCMYKPEKESEERSGAVKGQLRGVSGIYAGQVIPLEDGEKLVLGRGAEECNLIVDAPKISRRHCEITYHGQSGSFTLKDFSSNGTYKSNGEKYRPEEELTPGSTFFLGNKENGFMVK
ncbi:MAG: FHA domain-containing protein [Eubacteriales bacterium]|nr:FHA domain-containing protein [Eubacteriales bacterium]